MPRPPRTYNGLVRRASQRIPFLLPDGAEAGDSGNGPAENGKLDWPLQEPELDVLSPGELTVTAVHDDGERNEVRHESPDGAGLFFVMEPPAPARDGTPGRPARVTAAEATPEQAAYFRDARFALLGIMNPDGSISVIEPFAPSPPPDPPAQGGLF